MRETDEVLLGGDFVQDWEDDPDEDLVGPGSDERFASWLEQGFAAWKTERGGGARLDGYVEDLVGRLRTAGRCPSAGCEDTGGDVVEPDVDVACGHTPGYYRDGQGRWRYEHDRRLVPRSRDATIDGVYRPDCRAGSRLVPVVVVRAAKALSWCDRYPLDRSPVSGVAALQASHLVPCAHWRRRARLPIGIAAPELHPGRMLDTHGIAWMLGVSRATVASYVSRGYLPEPQSRAGGSPLWSLPVITAWFVSRPGPGRRPERTGKRPSSPRLAKARS